MTVAIYKIISRAQWLEALPRGVFQGSDVDHQDGYIHFSSAEQIAQTAARHFAGQTGLLILQVPAELLGDKLRWETSHGGQLFPHLYGELPCKSVEKVFELPIQPDGSHRLPDDLSEK